MTDSPNTNPKRRKRDYLRPKEEKPFPVDFQHLQEQGADVSEMFAQLTDELSRQFHINRGVLVVRRDDTRHLAAVSTWNNGSLRNGLSVNLPPHSSLFEKVAEHGCVYTESFCDSFSGNFFERRLLLGEDSRSFVVQPLKNEGKVIGLLGYSSEEPTAFTMFEEGALDKVAQDFATAIDKRRKQG